MMNTVFLRFIRDDSGATAIEYGLIAGLIAIAAIGGFTLVGEELTNLFGTVQEELQNAGATAGGAGGAGGGS